MYALCYYSSALLGTPTFWMKNHILFVPPRVVSSTFKPRSMHALCFFYGGDYMMDNDHPCNCMWTGPRSSLSIGCNSLSDIECATAWQQ